MTQLVAIDVGNESGRVMVIQMENAHLKSSEVYRFPNNPVTVQGTLYWDLLRLWHEIQQGLEAVVKEPIAGIAVDSFGVDFGLLDDRGQLLGNPVHMRDSRTEGLMEWVLERVPRETLYERTGIGFYVINTLYQLASLKRNAPWQLETARTLLTMPNLINYWLTGEIVSEFTHSTTTQCYNWEADDWDRATLETLGIPTAIFPPVVHPGVQVGRYRNIPVLAVASHDTGSAVVAVPTDTPHFAFISSGTWSLFGLETRKPLTNMLALDANITSEGGAFDTFRPLKLVMGMWLVQQCRAAWRAAGIDTSYERLLAQAEASPAFAFLIDPDDASFFPPGDMPARVRDFCRRSGQPAPETPGQVLRCVLESLALKYRLVLEELTAASGQTVDVIHIVGGGSQNPLLCQMTAAATGRLVLAGPVEATALGNALVQLIAIHELRDLVEARALVRASYPPTHYEPQSGAVWDEAYTRFTALLHR